MLKIIAIIIVVPLAALLVFAATKPDTFRVQRATTIKAPPEKIFPLINDLHRWGAWSPYEKKDPAMKKTLSGAESGKGAVYEWEGNKEVGKGRMEITDTSPPSRVTIKLDFVKPFEAHNIVDFTLEPKGDATNRHVGLARSQPLRFEGHGYLFQHGQHDRQGLRNRPCQPEDCRRNVSSTR